MIEPRRIVLEVVDVERSPIIGAEVTVLYDGQIAVADDVVALERHVTDVDGRATLVVAEPLRFGGWRWRLWWLIEVSDWPQPWRVRIRAPSAAIEMGLDAIVRVAGHARTPNGTVGAAVVRLFLE